MSEKKEYQVFIEDAYDEVYDHIIEVEMENRTDKISDHLRLYAQRMAIDHAFIESLVKYDKTVEQDELWAAIADTHKLHVQRL